MTLTEFIEQNNLRQADAIVLRKKIIGMVDHYAIFLGYRNNNPVFIANFREGVKEVSKSELSEFLQNYQPEKIDRFPGTEEQRPLAVKRAISRLGEKAYNYLSNNCEHFKNWVHYGNNYSSQVDNAGNLSMGVAAGFGLAALATKNQKAAGIAAGLLLAGVVLKLVADE